MPPRTLHLLLAAGPGAPGAEALLARAAAVAGRPVRILLSGEGLAWARDPRLAALGATDVAVCSRNARDAGWTLADAPPGIRWSSVAVWPMTLDDEDGPLWVALP